MKSYSSSTKLKNFLNKKIIFRCDGGNINEIGTGHIYRCLAIARFLEKKKIKRKNFLFITKKNKEFINGFKLISSEGYDVYSPFRNNRLDKKLEINTINNFKSELLIIDRLDNLKKNEILKLREKHKKIILIDSKSKYIKFVDLNLNPHIKNKYTDKNFGIKYLILPVQKTSNQLKKGNKIFLFFGGYDKKNILKKMITSLSKLNFKLKICVEEKHRKLCKNFKNLKFIFINKKNFFSHLKYSKFAITSGGMILFCSLKYCLPNISIAQYKHQKLNILRIAKNNGTLMMESAKHTKKLKYILSRFNNKTYINKFKKKININFSKNISENALFMILKLYDKENIRTF